MQRFATIVLLFLLVGCASRTQIHIFSLGIGDEEIEYLSNSLIKDGFDARPNSLPVPGRFLRHTVIFPSIVQDFSIVEQVQLAMEEAGFSNAQLILETEANHYYSTDNIGVYLIDPNFKGSAADLIQSPHALGGADATHLTFNYFSECPEGSEAQSELNLYPSGVAILEEFIWDDEESREVSVLHDGEWRSDSTSVEVDIFDGGEFLFNIVEHTGSNWFGPYEGLTLKNQSTTLDIEHCDYTHLEYED